MTTESAPAPRRRPPSLAREELRRAWHELRGPTQSPARAAAAVALGVFVGSFPLFGVHTPLVLVLCLWLRLDAALGWVASNVSNPLFAPFLVTAEVEVGSYLATGRFMPFDVERLGEVVSYALLGAPFVAAGLALVASALAYGLIRAGRAVGRGRWQRAPYALPSEAPAAWHAIERLAARFAPSTSTALGDRSRFHYLRVKLLRDASARRVLAEAGATPGALGTVLDLGMGHPELALLLLELGAAARVRAFGCDPAVVARAWRASCAEPALGAELESAAPEELEGLARAAGTRARADEPETGVDTILLFDVHEGLAPAEADALLGHAAAILRPGGRIFVRTLDGARGIRSRLARFGRAAVRGRPPARPARELAAVLAEAGLETQVVRAGSSLGARVLVVGNVGSLPGALLR